MLQAHLQRLLLPVAALGAALLLARPGQAQSFDLDPATRVADDCTSLSDPGWDVTTYSLPTCFDGGNCSNARARQGFRLMRATGSILGAATEPDIAFVNNGCGGTVLPLRNFPGLGGGDVNDFGIIAKGFICFPTTGVYSLRVNTDDGYELFLGAIDGSRLMGFDGGRACAVDSLDVNVTVPGVYAIYVTFFECGGGAGIEVYRSVGGTPYAIGSTVPAGAPADHPIVYSRMSGNRAPERSFEDPVAAGEDTVNVAASTKIAECGDARLGNPGWEVTMYSLPPDDVLGPGTSLKRTRTGMALSAMWNMSLGQAVGVPTLNYNDTGCGGAFLPSAEFPNLFGFQDNNDIGMLAKGILCVPAPGAYIFHADSDDGVEVIIGGGPNDPNNPSTNTFSFDGGRGCNVCDVRSRATVNFEAAGAYPIQVIWNEGGGGAGIELYRISDTGGYELIGATGTLTNQPIVYSTFDGDPAPDLISYYAANSDPNDAAKANPVPVIDGGTSTVTLTTAYRAAADCSTGLTEPGWDLSTYIVPPSFNPTFGLQRLKPAIRLAHELSFVIGHETGVDDINYQDTGCVGLFAPSRRFPGFPPTGDTNDFGWMFKGWMCFPQAGSFVLEIDRDDVAEFTIGTAASFLTVVSLDAPTGHGCNALDANQRFTLIVEQPGVYPVQIIGADGGGGAGIEFYRWVFDGSGNPVKVALIGADDAGLADQPRVFSLLNGQAPPDLSSTYGTLSGEPIPLAATEKVSGGPAGQSGLLVKTVKAPAGTEMYTAHGDAGDMTALQLLDVMNDRTSGTPTPTVVRPVLNFRGSPTQGDGTLPGGETPPGFGPFTEGAGEEQYGLRAEGFITFPTAGFYLLEADVDDDAFIRVGRQTIWSRGCCGGQFFMINVTDAGTYPFRLEFIEGGGDDRVEFGQVTAAGVVPVNGPGSTIQLTTAATSGPYNWGPISTNTLTADRKVAEVGEGGDVGWNVTIAKGTLPGPTSIAIPSIGIGMLFVENELLSLGSGFAVDRLTFVDDIINYTDPNNSSARFGGDTLFPSLAPFLPGPDNNDFAIGGEGYVEFPAPGFYAINSRTDDSFVLWIAGLVVHRFSEPTGDTENTIGSFYVEEAGLYPIRFDWHENGGGANVEIFEYQPNGNVVLLNDAASVIKVYSNLDVAPATTRYANPHRLVAGTAAAPIDRGGDPGFNVWGVDPTFPGGGDSGNPLAGSDKFNHNLRATARLDALIGGNPLLGPGILTEGTVDTLEGASAYAAVSVGGDQFAVRVTGYLAIPAGCHLFGLATDDGVDMYLGGADPEDARVNGYNVMETHSWKGASNATFMVCVAEDGLYPFNIDQWEDGGGEGLTFTEITWDGVALTEGAVNGTGLPTVRAYRTISPCEEVWADLDGDGDVDNDDFGLWQACFTGTGGGPLTTDVCKCADGDNDGDVDDVDYDVFETCVSGPEVPLDANCL